MISKSGFMCGVFAALVIGFVLGIFVQQRVQRARSMRLEHEALEAMTEGRRWYCIDKMPCIEGKSIEVIITTKEDDK